MIDTLHGEPIEIDANGVRTHATFRVRGSLVEVSSDLFSAVSPVSNGDALATAVRLLARFAASRS